MDLIDQGIFPQLFNVFDKHFWSIFLLHSSVLKVDNLEICLFKTFTILSKSLNYVSSKRINCGALIKLKFEFDDIGFFNFSFPFVMVMERRRHIVTMELNLLGYR